MAIWHDGSVELGETIAPVIAELMEHLEDIDGDEYLAISRALAEAALIGHREGARQLAEIVTVESAARGQALTLEANITRTDGNGIGPDTLTGGDA